ncbi:MAG TPA: DNA recombination protein RmuC, partial [Arthrobacter sp.]|nr:DNA recombination protein RmuC [Arthrobacter sp.]
SPELVICFVPAESILAAALSADPALLDHALSRNVVLASPGTLLAVLKSVAFTWRQDVLTDSARELFELARQLYERMGTLGDNIGKLGSSLKSSVDRYNAMVGTLEARVLPTARKLNALDTSGLATPPAVQVTPRSLAAPELQGAELQGAELQAAELPGMELYGTDRPAAELRSTGDEEEDAA